MSKLTDLFEKYINSFSGTEVKLIHGGYVIFESTSLIVNEIKRDLEKFDIEIETVGRGSYRFSVKYPKGQLKEVVQTLIEKAA